MRSIRLITLLASLVQPLYSLATEAYEFSGTEQISLDIPNQQIQEANSTSTKESNKQQKRSSSQLTEHHATTVMKYKLTEAQKQALRDKLKAMDTPVQNSLSLGSTNLPSSASLGMNSVPVLDQGLHGTCTTFAVTGAFDAALGKGDQVSQLCSLTLGNYLHDHYYESSGWDGAYIRGILNRFQSYGYWKLHDQHLHGCGGWLLYPAYVPAVTGGSTTPAKYAERSHSLGNIQWQYLGRSNLDAVKAALASGHRVVFSTLLDTHIFLSVGGATANHKSIYDTWVLNKTIRKDIRDGKIDAGHTMIITGYSDKAKVGKSKGLLTLRNSWGSLVGHWGDFYMSYDYFKTLSFDAYAIIN